MTPITTQRTKNAEELILDFDPRNEKMRKVRLAAHNSLSSIPQARALVRSDGAKIAMTVQQEPTQIARYTPHPTDLQIDFLASNTVVASSASAQAQPKKWDMREIDFDFDDIDMFQLPFLAEVLRQEKSTTVTTHEGMSKAGAQKSDETSNTMLHRSCAQKLLEEAKLAHAAHLRERWARLGTAYSIPYEGPLDRNLSTYQKQCDVKNISEQVLRDELQHRQVRIPTNTLPERREEKPEAGFLDSVVDMFKKHPELTGGSWF